MQVPGIACDELHIAFGGLCRHCQGAQHPTRCLILDAHGLYRGLILRNLPPKSCLIPHLALVFLSLPSTHFHMVLLVTFGALPKVTFGISLPSSTFFPQVICRLISVQLRSLAEPLSLKLPHTCSLFLLKCLIVKKITKTNPIDAIIIPINCHGDIRSVDKNRVST